MLAKYNLNNIFQFFKYYKPRTCECCQFYEAKYLWCNIMLCGNCVEFRTNPRHSVRNIAEIINVLQSFFSAI